MKSFKFWNNLTGWGVFAVAAITYLLTMEPSSSLWDCSEFIATSYKLEIGHPPGAPLFMILARIATIFAPSPHYVPHMVNGMNCIASAFCILFLFWTITHIARRLFTSNGQPLSQNNQIAAIGAGVIGALAYTFTDTFWFSAVEGEVYALSSMFTALVVWLMLKWEDEADEPHALRWIILIALLMGLSIGVHILNLLTIPALVFIYYFRKNQKITIKGAVVATLISGAILLFINIFVISKAIWLGAMIDTLFVNHHGLAPNTGMVVYSLVLIGGLGCASYYTHKKGKVLANVICLSLTMLFIGYSSYASVTIRAVANPPMNSNNPNNPHALLSLLNRDQYGNRPLLYGACDYAYNSEKSPEDYSPPIRDYAMRKFYYLGEDGKYKKGETIDDYIYPVKFMRFFPRIWNANKAEESYINWSSFHKSVKSQPNEQGESITWQDFGKTTLYKGKKYKEPTAMENFSFFINYQFNYMYWRYFLWNFVGRQNDIQAQQVTIADGNWLSGIDFIDEAYLGPQSKLPSEVEDNKARNNYYFLPFILGLIGLIYQLNRDPKNFSIVMWLFIMMGIALVVYFNSSPGEPRERDYVYAGSFYAFTIWIGLGMLAIRDFIAWGISHNTRGVVVTSFILSLSVPMILAHENWDDHDRSHRTFARDIGYNYLESTLPNSIIMNYGDNDTFPLWFNQEVDGVRLDVRVMNTSYLGGEWYIDQMKLKSNESDPVPFSLPRSKYAYVNDYIQIDDLSRHYNEQEYRYLDREGNVRSIALGLENYTPIKDVVDFIASDHENTKCTLQDGTSSDFVPTNRISIPVNRENVLKSGIVKAEDADLIEKSINIELRTNVISKVDMMLLDLLANFDWKRPLYFTQPYILSSLDLYNYLQFDGFAYRLVPIKTENYDDSSLLGRVDVDYAAPLLLEKFRWGNLKDKRVYVDNFIHYTIGATSSREAFVKVAQEALKEGRKDLAIKLLDKGLEVLPTSQIRYTYSNTMPYIECYYLADEIEKGDALLKKFLNNTCEYINYYMQFTGEQSELIAPLLYERLEDLSYIYQTADNNNREEIINMCNTEYYKLNNLFDSNEGNQAIELI